MAWAFAAMVLLFVAVWLGAPPLIKSQGESRLSAVLGRPVTLGHVVLHPWALELVVDDVRIGGPAGSTEPLLALDRLRVNLSASSLFRRAPVVEAVDIVRPRVRIAHTSAGHYDVDDLISRFTPKADAPAGDPARFAVYNVQLSDGEVRFDDRPAARVHEVKRLQLSLPFLSNLPAQVDVTVAPRLAFELHGATFDSGAQATPFAQTRAGTIKLDVDRFDLEPYLVYSPKALPVRLVRGVIDSDLEAAFALAPSGAPTFALHGSVQARDVAVVTQGGDALVGWSALKLGLADVQPLARKLHFASVELDGLSVAARRTADGRIDGVPVASGVTPAPAATAASTPASGASATLAADTPPGWHVQVDAFKLHGGKLAWSDATVSPAATLDVVDIEASAGQVVFPPAGKMPLSLSARLRGPGKDPQDWGTLSVQGEGGATEASATFTADAFALDALAPYVRAVATPRLGGQVSAKGQVSWAASEQGRLQLRLDQATVDALSLTETGTGATRDRGVKAVSLKRAAVSDVLVDVPGRSVVVGEFKLVQPTVALLRADTGLWNAQQWLAANSPAAAASGPAAAPASAPPPAGSASVPGGWKVSVKSFVVDAGQLKVTDAKLPLGGKARVTDVGPVGLVVQDLVYDGDRPVPPASVRLSAKTGTGQVAFNGKVGLAPRQASGTLSVTRFPIHTMTPYAGIQQNVAVAHAEAGFKGSVNVRLPEAGPTVSVKGDLLLADLLLQTRTGPDDSAAGDDLLQWQGLALDGLSFEMKPGARPKLDIDNAVLNDLRARLVVTEQGRLNLQDAAGTRVGPQGPAEAASAVPADGAASAPPVAVENPASAGPGAGKVADAPAPANAPGGTTVRAQVASGEPLPIDITLNATRITNGRIDFSDNFVRPKYSAELTQLNGRLGAISSTNLRSADLELKGRAAGTADLEISGQVQPLSHPITLDIKARASDLELAPLSPYAAKYVGYVIERGKLTMDVAYRIDPDGRLEAQNQVVINQLAFGDKVESPQATSLPVRLAVSLLTDRHGVIDINLPVSGSLDDPQFSVAGVIWKVLGNLIAKAVTSPFSLLAGGGKTDISVLPAVPGTPRLTAEGAASIDKVAAALTDRPALKLTITGTSDAATERDAYQRQVLDTRLVAERRKEVLATGGATDAAVSLSAADRSRLLKLLYKQTDLPDKPRNALGFARDLPDAEMEARLKARVPVDDDVMRELALQRAVAVRDTIAAKGVAAQRLFLAAPKGKGEAGWVPSVKLTLAMD